MACGTCGGGPRRWRAVDRLTGDCLVTERDGSCRQFRTREGAVAAAKAVGHVDPRAMLV